MQEQEFNQKLKKFEEQLKPVKQQIDSVEQALSDLYSLHTGLDEIKEGQKILAPVGKGIFVKAEVLSEKLTVDVGGKRYVKKDIQETKNVIGNQLEKLQQAREDLNQQLEKINQQLSETMKEYQQNK